MTTKPKTKPTTKRKRKTSTPLCNGSSYCRVDIGIPEPAFFAKALSFKGRFILGWILFVAAVRVLVTGRALV